MSEPGADEVEAQADAVADFLEELLDLMGFDAIAEPSERGGRMYVDIADAPPEELSLLIGREGQTLEAIQELTRMIVGHRIDERIRVIVDVEDVRKRREERIAEVAREAAETAVETGEPVHLDAMNPFERKIAHDAIALVEGAESASEGEEPNRHVVAFPA